MMMMQNHILLCHRPIGLTGGRNELEELDGKCLTLIKTACNNS